MTVAFVVGDERVGPIVTATLKNGYIERIGFLCLFQIYKIS